MIEVILTKGNSFYWVDDEPEICGRFVEHLLGDRPPRIKVTLSREPVDGLLLASPVDYHKSAIEGQHYIICSTTIERAEALGVDLTKDF